MATAPELARGPKPSRLPSLGFGLSVCEMEMVIHLPHSTRRSGSQNKPPETGRSGLALLLGVRPWKSLPCFCRKNLAYGKLFTIWFLFRKGLVFYPWCPPSPAHQEYGWRTPM